MDIRSTLTALTEAFNAHDLDRIMAFFSDDCVLEMPRGSKPWGARFDGTIPRDERLVGLELDLQLLQTDAGASRGIAFSAGLALTSGY